MKTVFIGRYNPGDKITGPEKVAARIFSVHSADNECEFITYFFDGKKYGLLKKLFGYEQVAATKNGRVIRAGIFMAFLRLMLFRPDVIHIISFERFALTALKYRSLFRTKVIYTVHGIASYENENFKNVSEEYKVRDKKTEAAIFRYSDKVIFLSEQSLKISESLYEIDRSKCFILPNGVDEIFCRPSNKDFDVPILNLVFSGNIKRKEKGFDLLKEALDIAKIDYRLFVLNSGTSGTEGMSTFLGQLSTEELADFLKDKHIFISSSVYEPFSLSAAESMAAGLAVIASDATGMCRYIENGRNGIVFDSGNAAAIAGHILMLNNDRALLKAISDEARKTGRILSWENVHELYKEQYK